MLIQRLWEEHLHSDELLSPTIGEVWEKRIAKIMELRRYSINKSYLPQEGNVTEVQLHGLYDASEGAYAGVSYIRGIH